MFQVTIETKEVDYWDGKDNTAKRFVLNLSSGEKMGQCLIVKSRKELMNLQIYDRWQRKGFGKYLVREIMKDHRFYLRCGDSKIPFYLSCGLIQEDYSSVKSFTTMNVFNHGIIFDIIP